MRTPLKVSSIVNPCVSPSASFVLLVDGLSQSGAEIFKSSRKGLLLLWTEDFFRIVIVSAEVYINITRRLRATKEENISEER